MDKKLPTIEEVKQQMNAVSSSFCLAKWLQVTVHLQNGQTHSCHHPRLHHVPLDELEADPSALHNTTYKKIMRKDMLDGKQPEECNYCWNIENLSNKDLVSDRILKSKDLLRWDEAKSNEIKTLPWNASVNPLYLEVSFSSVCNFKCSYCYPHISSKWMEEIKQYGAYPTSRNHNNLKLLEETKLMPIPNREENPYVKAFWKWWPSLYPDLKVFRVTGGEPLLSQDTFDVLDYFIKNPHPDLEFAINTNLGIPDALLDKFIEKMKIISENKSIKSCIVYTSTDAWGKRAEYARNGMVFDKFWGNVRRVNIELPKVNFAFMNTYNALSVTGFTEFLIHYAELKKEFSTKPSWIHLDTPYLRHPLHQTIKILTPDFGAYIEESLRFINESDLFQNNESIKMKRILEWFNESDTKDLDINRADFYRFITEHDKRRGTNFLEVFPEMDGFLDLCKGCADDT